jgi:glycosyltransferase involved in cell wall biosynthesis
MGKIKLSIIIPAYKAEPYIYELFDCLNPQITEEVEVMVIDDGSPVPVKVTYPWIQLYRQENQGVSTARNYGIEHTTGEYIAFIDADDLVAKDYIATLLYKIDTEHFDYIELSWKSLPGKTEQYTCKLNSFKDKMTNPSACTRAFKRTFIGNVRFNTKKQSSEDENFTRQLDFKNGKRAIATEFMYFYRTNNQNSKSHRFWRGELDTQQIVYHYKHGRFQNALFANSRMYHYNTKWGVCYCNATC